MDISTASKFRRIGNRNLIARIFGRGGLSRLGNSGTVTRIHCTATNNNNVRGIRPFLFHRRANGFTLTRGNGLIGSHRLTHCLRGGKDLFRSASSDRLLTRLVGGSHKAGRHVRGVISTLGVVRNTFTFLVLDSGHLCYTHSGCNLHPLSVKGLGNKCIISSRAYTLSIINTRFIHSIRPNRVIVVSTSNLQSISCSGFGRRCVYTVRCICFTHPSDSVRNRGIRTCHGRSNHLLCHRSPIRTSVMVNIPSSDVDTTVNCDRRDNVPCRVKLVGGGCINHAFVRPDRRLHRGNIHVGLSTIHSVIGNGHIIVVSSSVIHNAASHHVITLLGRTNTIRIRIHVTSPPCTRPYFCNISATACSRLVSSHVSIRRLYRAVNTSSLGFLSIRKLCSDNRHYRLYATYFSNGCPASLCDTLSPGGYWSGCAVFGEVYWGSR